MPVPNNAIGPNFLTLQVRDVQRSLSFYTELVGFEAAESSKNPNAAVLETQPIKLALRKAQIDLDAVPELGWGVVLWVKAENPDKLAAELAAADVTITKPPCDGFCGREFQFRDPDGYELTIYEG
jgi:catechol 2,3-dioxygenase-like lactoylglutathione lyase family enzyme